MTQCPSQPIAAQNLQWQAGLSDSVREVGLWGINTHHHDLAIQMDRRRRRIQLEKVVQTTQTFPVLRPVLNASLFPLLQRFQENLTLKNFTTTRGEEVRAGLSKDAAQDIHHLEYLIRGLVHVRRNGSAVQGIAS
ncbi:hypothetical protein B446_25060 [Streptomyces collinus Tu 365]|uniref:Uncharacterized protein n=1 Tax=Streptomyces collinus (strain DSM 40733 / Tue 365) TaxID=1214242 RepID=S5UX59_STRC3|nr:hypothetical protein B446_25060 [Streptomyces collinus Tu 365]